MIFSPFSKPRRFGDEVLKVRLWKFSLFRCTWNHNGKPFEFRYCKHPKLSDLWMILNGKVWRLRYDA